MQPPSAFAPAHDAVIRLLNRLEPDPETLGKEAQPLVARGRGVLVLDDSTRDHLYAQHIQLVTRHGSGKPRNTVPGISLLWTDGDRA